MSIAMGNKLISSRLRKLWFEFIIILIFLLFVSCESPCQNDIIIDNYNQNSDKHVVVFVRNCGATTGYTTQVSVLDKKETIDKKKGNIFAADTNHQKAPSGPKGGPIILARWIDNNNLEITYDGRIRIYRNEMKYRNVNIIYKTLSSAQ